MALDTNSPMIVRCSKCTFVIQAEWPKDAKGTLWPTLQVFCEQNGMQWRNLFGGQKTKEIKAQQYCKEHQEQLMGSYCTSAAH